MNAPSNKILERMLERLRAALMGGPLLSCRPHSSRQRIDVVQLGKLTGPQPSELLSHLLGPERSVKLAFPKSADDKPPQNGSNGKARDEYQTLWSKLRAIAEDARTYEQDTGVHALFLGYPLLHLPPGNRSVGGGAATKRILAPLAFVPIQLVLKTTRPPGVTLEAIADGSDLIVPNAGLLAWIQQTTGKRIADELADDESGKDPWGELRNIVEVICKALGIAPPVLDGTSPILPTPRSDDEDGKQPSILPSAVLGLFPVSNQSLIGDMEALVDGEPAQGPIQSFLTTGSELGLRGEATGASFDVAADRCVSLADPCQARAVAFARRSTGLVIHGPPGTGKSQTITNIIADHLANGERVLFVCDKRTALDVVQHRLDHLGLGDLCAVVHDARRDQRELYKAIREQLDALPDARPGKKAPRSLKEADDELRQLHRELSAYTEALNSRPHADVASSFHELVGRWFAVEVPTGLDGMPSIGDVNLEKAQLLERDSREIFDRGLRESYSANPWTQAAGLSLSDYLASSHEHWQARLSTLQAAARALDDLGPVTVPFDPSLSIPGQAEARLALAGALQAVKRRGCTQELVRWLRADAGSRELAHRELGTVEPLTEHVEAQPLDRELLPVLAGAEPKLPELAVWLGRLASYLQIATKWYRFLFFGRRRDALGIVQRFGLALGNDTAGRVHRFVDGLRVRQILQQWHASLFPPPAEARLLPDGVLAKAVRDQQAVFGVLHRLAEPIDLRPVVPLLEERLRDDRQHDALLAELEASGQRAGALDVFARALKDASLVSGPWRDGLFQAACAGRPVFPEALALVQRQGTLEGILRVRERLAALTPEARQAHVWLLDREASADDGSAAVQKAIVAGELRRRIASTPVLQQMDGERLRASYERYRSLEEERRELAREVVLHTWMTRQRDRLLASTGSRLNSAGAEVRRRLVTRGERALRLRQVVATGRGIEGGDPLFDLRPVWMASPEVAAQIFPRDGVFDVVVFDEASQCRLEEALPVLLRARRVVIAGDPKQLPPSRFFESAVTQSQDDEAETEQELFEAQQSEVEDLLGAALNLSIEQAYLDVHYRSQNSDLIEFSNGNFYEARLQAIPAHPSNFAKVPPLDLIQVGGVYEKRINPREVTEVVRIVRDLLTSDNPPSIGVACFNLAQRDAIVEALDSAAGNDSAFGARLAAARSRRGTASFEGLFVKNLENVQGDERDHMVISTTYGPDPAGKFYRRFGPLGMAGGGRRLNVLVTRARQKVHIVTSIPPQVYRSLPPAQPGMQPNGGWLLFAYLKYAEDLREAYAKAAAIRAGAEPGAAAVRVLETPSPSELAAALAKHLAGQHATASDVHWGNDGFCVDAALAHPLKPDEVTLGVLCDSTRFAKAPDRVQWDVFRTGVLERQGWRFFRLWSPQFFRDPKGTVSTLMSEVQRWLAEQKAQEAERPKAASEVQKVLH